MFGCLFVLIIVICVLFGWVVCGGVCFGFSAVGLFALFNYWFNVCFGRLGVVLVGLLI